MSSLGGPSIVTSGLVLHLDASNIKSYPGEETVNLITNPIPTSTSNFVVNGGIGTSTYDSSINAVRWVRTSYETWGAFYYNSSLANYLFDTTATYSISFKWKYGPSHSAGTYQPYFNIIQDNGLNTIMGNYVLTQNSTLLSDGWYYFKATGTPSNPGITQTGAAPGFRIITGSQSGITDIYWKNLQFEKKTYSTPFVNGTRGTTVATSGGWIDRSGNGNNGQILNGPTYNSLKGGSIVFDGVNDCVSILPYVLTSQSNSLSFNFWVYATGTSSTSQTILAKDSNVSGFGHLLIRRTSSTNLTFNTQTTTSNTLGVSNVFLNNIDKWVNIQITMNYTTGDFILYQNGNSFYSTNLGLGIVFPNTNVTTYIGSFTTPGFLPWTGNIASVQIYNRVLSATEVLQNYNATKSRFI